jgi:hypothetical protein
MNSNTQMPQGNVRLYAAPVVLLLVVLGVLLLVWKEHGAKQRGTGVSVAPTELPETIPPPEVAMPPPPFPDAPVVPAPVPVAAEDQVQPGDATNKLHRLLEIQVAFRRLAAADPISAIRAAKELKDEGERETALFTLVSQWTQGELNPPRQRARAILAYGLEAGLGLELTKKPELAVLWANELAEGNGRAAILQETAINLVSTDPAGAMALGQHLPKDQRQEFADALMSGWAQNDTDAALNWARQISDPAEREAAMQSIRNVAPVGIGAALSLQDGYPVITQLLAGTPAERSGQLKQGDRIVAVAQGNNPFVDAHGVSLPEVIEMIRGTPGTTLHLQVLPAGAQPNTQPRTVTIIRDQIKFKR